MTNQPSEEAVRTALEAVIDPELGDNVVDLGMVRRVEVGADGVVDVTIALTTAGCPLRAQLMTDVKLRAGALPGVTEVRVHFGEMTDVLFYRPFTIQLFRKNFFAYTFYF